MRHRPEHRHQIALKVHDDGEQGPHVNGDVEREPELLTVEPEEHPGQNQVRGARHRQKLGQPLNNPKKRSLN